MINLIIEKLNSVDSTNDYLAREVIDGKLIKDKVLIAKEQTMGHGKNNAKFFSHKDKGIYFSFLHFYNDERELSYITQKAAVAVYMTFKYLLGIELSIKWINDLYYNNKKVAGILCKNIISKKAVIIGIGIDLFYDPDIDDSIKDIAGYIYKDKSDLYEQLISYCKAHKIDMNTCEIKHLIDDMGYIDYSKLSDEAKKLLPEIKETATWEPDHIVYPIVAKIYDLIDTKGLPRLYIEKNIVKDSKIYEDCILEC